MESPQLAWEFMKKLANSPWAPMIRLIEDPEILGTGPKLDLKEDLEDCAAVVEEANPRDPLPPCLREDLEDCAMVAEETGAPAQQKTSVGCSSEDSDDVPQYFPSPSDSDDYVEVCELAAPSPSPDERLSTPRHFSSNSSSSGKKSRKTSSKSKRHRSSGSKPKAKSPHRSSLRGQVSVERKSGDETEVPCDASFGSHKSFEYDGHYVKLRRCKIVLIDLVHISEQYVPVQSEKTPENREDERSNEKSRCDSKQLALSSSHTMYEKSNSSDSSEANKLKRPGNLSWGLDSIHELEKRRRWGKSVKNNVDVDSESGCSSGSEAPGTKASVKAVITSSLVNFSSSSKPKPSTGGLFDTSGMNAWRLGLVQRELQRLEELAESLQKNPLKFEAQKQVAYKFKYGLNEIARLVSKKSLNSIVAKHEALERLETESVLGEGDTEAKGVGCPVPKGGSKETSTSPETPAGAARVSSPTAASSDPSGRPVVDVHAPTLVQGVAAGFLGVINCLDRLESRCEKLEKALSK